MSPKYNLKERQIILSERSGVVVWCCSNCHWTVPLALSAKSAANSIQSVRQFVLHRCESHPAAAYESRRSS